MVILCFVGFTGFMLVLLDRSVFAVRRGYIAFFIQPTIVLYYIYSGHRI